jgi:methylmalonyl-CoA/ethylmalonyl-CoA epimerase
MERYRSRRLSTLILEKNMIKKLSHIGVSVLDIEKTRDLFTSVFKTDFPAPYVSKETKAGFPKLGDVVFEVIEPRTTEGIKSLEKKGEGISHLCFEVDNLEEEIKNFTAKGLRLLGDGVRVRPGRRSAFFASDDTFGIMLQLVQFDEDRTGSPY